MTPLRQLLDTKVGSLDSYVAERRDVGHSWASIAADLFADTKVKVTDETLRNWFGQDAA